MSVQYLKSYQFSLVKDKSCFGCETERQGVLLWCLLLLQKSTQLSDQSPTPFSFVNFLYFLRNRYVPRCEVSMAYCWFDIQFSIIAKNPHLVQPTVLSVAIGSDFTYVSIADCWSSCYHPKQRLIFHPLFFCGIIIRYNPQFYPLE